MGFEASSSFESVQDPESSREALEREQLLQQLRDLRERLAANGGERLVAQAADYMAGEITSIELRRSSKKIQNVEQLTIDAITRLSEQGFIEIVEHPETREDVFVIDPAQIAGLGRDALGKIVGPLAYDGNEQQNRTKSAMLALIFKDIQAITPEQLRQGDFNEKPFLYIPETADAAIDPAEIKQVDFQTTLWDLAQTHGATEKYPVADGPAADRLETRLATILFHPSYGDGYRDKNGTLYVRDSETREYKKFSTRTLGDYNISGNILIAQEGKVVRTNRQGLAELAPNLIARGVLHKEDFRAIRSQKTGDYSERVVRERIKTHSVMFNRVNHYVGRQFIGSKAVLMSPTTGGILEHDDATGEEKLTHVFNAFDSEKFPIPAHRNDFGTANVKDTKPRPFNQEEFANDPAVLDYIDFVKAKKDLSEVGVQIESGNIVNETNLARAVRILTQQNQYDKFLNFAKKNKEVGVNALTAASDDAPYVEAVLKIGSELSAEKARDFFTLDPQDESTGLAEESVRHTTRELFLNYANNGQAIKNPAETQKALARAKTEVRLSIQALKIAQKNSNVSIENLRGVQFVAENAADLQPKDRAMMIGVFERARQDLKAADPALFTEELVEFKQKLEASDSQFYLVKRDGVVTAFFRYDTSPNGDQCFGSFNVDGSLQNAGIGKALLQAAIEEKGNKHAIVLSVLATEDSVVNLYEKQGFVKTDTETFGGKTFLILKRAATQSPAAPIREAA